MTACQEVQEDFPTCRCAEWPAKRTSYSGGDFKVTPTVRCSLCRPLCATACRKVLLYFLASRHAPVQHAVGAHM